MLILVALEGVKSITDLQKLQFGRGYDYREPLMIGMQNVANALQKEIVSQIYQMIYPEEIQKYPECYRFINRGSRLGF